MVPSTAEGHPEWVLIGGNSGNFKKHGDHYHDTLVSALKKIVLETPKEEVVFAVQAHIDSLRLPGQRNLDSFLGRDNTRISDDGTWRWSQSSRCLSRILVGAKSM